MKRRGTIMPALSAIHRFGMTLLSLSFTGCGSLSMLVDLSRDLTVEEMEQIETLKASDLKFIQVGGWSTSSGDYRIYPFLPFYFHDKFFGTDKIKFLGGQGYDVLLLGYMTRGIIYDRHGKLEEGVTKFGLWPLLSVNTRTDLKSGETKAKYVSFVDIPIVGTLIGFGSCEAGRMYSILFIPFGIRYRDAGLNATFMTGGD